MIEIVTITGNLLEITATEKLAIDDFPKIAPQIDAIISQYGVVRLLIYASAFAGWENLAAFEQHAEFVKKHQQKVERIAFVTSHDWQRWLVGAVRIFLHPEIRAFDASQQAEALRWIAPA